MDIPQHLRITNITITPIEKPEELDRRYRVLVILNRSERPKYWTFHCPQCKMPVSEILNAEVESISDLIDTTNINNIGLGVRCDGRYMDDKCRIWYYFKLNGRTNG